MFTTKSRFHSNKAYFHQFIDSRGIDPSVELQEAVYTSQPVSRWLYSPSDLPRFSTEELSVMKGMDYRELALTILSRFDWGISGEELRQIINEAYNEANWNKPMDTEKWYTTDIAPVRYIWKNLFSLHLGYGPTFAFKNFGLEFLPRFLDLIIAKIWQKNGSKKVAHVLGASSGDTINAAHKGVEKTEHIKSIFMLPVRDPVTGKWPSIVQELQAKFAITNNRNAHTILADVPFDPLQAIIKEINTAKFSEFKEEFGITSFNSINIARILAQTVYYFHAYKELVKSGDILNGCEVIFSVPSGNFWDALAGLYAKWMWLPIKFIHVATNQNDVLHTFIQTGRYEPKDEKKVIVTNSPSQDIANSSNLERALLLLTDNDTNRVKKWYSELKSQWYFQVDDETLKKIQTHFRSSKSTDTERWNTMKNVQEYFQHDIDPHTATAVVTWERDGWENHPFHEYRLMPVIVLETSHSAQFRDEISAQWIVMPWSHEFDETIRKMQKHQPVEGIHYTSMKLAHLTPEERVDLVAKTVRHIAEEVFPNR